MDVNGCEWMVALSQDDHPEARGNRKSGCRVVVTE